MNLRHLEIFRRVAEAGGIRAAARDAALTQPAMTYAIRELERTVGVALFVRSARGVVPTEIGQALLRRAAVLFDEVRRTEDEIAQLRDGGGHLRAAFSSLAAARLLPDALLAFRRRCPGVALELVEITSPEATGPGSGHDLAVLSELEGTAEKDGLEREVLLQAPLAAIARAGHPLARVRTLRRLAEALWAVPAYGVQALQQAGLAAPRNTVVCQSIQFGLSLVRNADALTLVAASLAEDPVASRGLVRLRLAEPLPRVQVSVRLQAWSRLTPAARAFVECLREAAAGPARRRRAPG
ncbi:LysR substrate-binding domain-containing protein [Variovorax sp. LjRoot84]|uniref:LysR family transcriptional regulator n=1 Tax=unclassified Variovorax TaxID=663243 RepID=UPI00088D9390|nr:LysR substrate-binding domain-containing protein [Variovorax sp. CF079]SDC28438.1 transcriptional regulator, LysR family [Variovorax sp. CF079]